MQYEFIALADSDVPQVADQNVRDALSTYAGEANMTAGVWRAVPDELLDFKPHENTNSILAILVHHLVSEHRFFAQFVGMQEPPVEELLPPGEKPAVSAYLDKHISSRRLLQLAKATGAWWLEIRRLFGDLKRERIWVFCRHVLRTSHRRTEVESWLRLAGQHVPANDVPSGDLKCDEANPTGSLEAVKRGSK
jgi:hypothetical protein